MTMRMGWIAIAGMVLVSGCAAEKQDTRKQEPIAAEAGGDGSATVTAEQNDAIDQLFRRKATQLQHCWQEEYERTQNRKLEGDLSLQMVISRGGKASGVKIVKSSMGAPTVEACVVAEINTWTFPEGPGDAPYRRTVHLGAEF